MVLETINENLCVNKLLATKKDVIMVEGEMIVPDSKPDILNIICTSGVVCVYKKEAMDEKIRIDGNINTYIMYLADDVKDKVRGISTSLDFSETMVMPNSKEGMDVILQTKLKSIESRVINERKVGIKATLEIEAKIYEKEEIEIVNDIKDAEGIQILKQDLRVNSLVGMGENKVYVKDNISINTADDLAEILKADISIVNKEIKVSYNKILAKSEAKIKIMYLTEDNRINLIETKMPIVGFIDMPNVVEENICEVNYEVKNVIIKPNGVEEHSINVEIEVGIFAIAYEEKSINLIQDLYSPCENLEFDKKQITTLTNMQCKQDKKQIHEKIEIKEMENKQIVNVDVNPIIENRENFSNSILYTGILEIDFILANEDLQIEMRHNKIPFDYTINDVNDAENMNNIIDMEVANQDFVIQEGGSVTANVDLLINSNMHRSANINVMNEIQIDGEKEEKDYNLVIYLVKSGDTLWNIAKNYGSTIQDILKVNKIENQDKIYSGQKLFIPRYMKMGISNG